MNGKKHRRRAPKITQKVDRGQHRRAMETKSHIGTKRITLLPGFLINGFTTRTIKKAKAMEIANQKKNILLHDDLHALLEQNGKYLRRSQRILNKNVDQQSAISSKISSIADLDQLVNTSPSLKTIQPKNISFQPILKNTSKSRFKEINEKFARIQLHNAEKATQKVPPSQTNKNQNFDCSEEHCSHINQNPSKHQNAQFEPAVSPKQPCSLILHLNRSFCRDLDKQICVSFKKNVFKESRENIVKEVATVDMVLAGKIQLEEMIIQNSSETTDDDTRQGPGPKFYPVSPRNWLYRTPPNQKIGLPKLEERKQLQPAVLYQNKHQQNLYEVKAGRSVDFLQGPQVNVPIDNRFLKKVAQVRKTPVPFGFGLCGGMNGDLNGLWQPWRGPEDGENQETCVTPRIDITRQSKIPPPTFRSEISAPLAQKITSKNMKELQDFTFIEEGDEFKLQESQPASMQGNKRRSSKEEVPIKRRNVNEMKMFNFGTQERNIFDFGKI